MINLHPQVVHFPVALVFTLGIYELWFFFKKQETGTSARSLLLVIAFLGAAAAVGTGLWYEEFMPHPHEGVVHEIMEQHETLGWVVFGGLALLNIINFFLRTKKWNRPVYRMLLVLTLVGVATQAYLGGELGHTHGLSLPEGQHPPMHLHEH